MNGSQNGKSGGPFAFIPFSFGTTALACCAVYHAQRSDLLFPAFSHAVQPHLNELAGCALVGGILGGLSGVVIIQFRGQNRPVTFGTLISVAALFWSFLLPL